MRCSSFLRVAHFAFIMPLQRHKCKFADGGFENAGPQLGSVSNRLTVLAMPNNACIITYARWQLNEVMDV